MNEITLTELKVLVERAVRPVAAGMRTKQKMREELLAHVSAAYTEEFEQVGEHTAALARTAERFGEPVELAAQLQATVPARDAFDRLLDRIWYRPGEPTLRRAVRHAVLLDGSVFACLLAVFTLLRATVDGGSSWAALVVYGTAVLLALFFFVVGMTFLAESLRRVLDGSTDRPRLMVALTAVAALLLLPSLGIALWLDGFELTVHDLLIVCALGLVVPGLVMHLAQALADRLRIHREWTLLQLDSTTTTPQAAG